MGRSKPLAERFEAKVDRSGGPNACHIWTGGVGQYGFPHVYVSKGVSHSGRRVAWELANGPIPPKRWITATCDEKRCVNVRHLVMRAHHDDVARFWENVDKSGECWVWTGSLSHRGYGVFQFPDHSTLPAHRYVWEMGNGPIGDPTLFVCHHCDNPRCVRLAHLFLGTAKDNHDDMMRKGRHAHGPEHSERMKKVAKAIQERRTLQKVICP